MKSNKATVKVMTPKADAAPIDQPIAPLVKQILERLGEDPRREGLGAHARARGTGAAVPDQRLRHGRE